MADNNKDLRWYDNGYWGYLHEDVRETIAHKLWPIQVVDPVQGHLAVNQWEVGFDGLGVLGNTDTLTLKISGCPEYADDTAAGVGGLVAGQVYKTATGELRIKL